MNKKIFLLLIFSLIPLMLFGCSKKPKKSTIESRKEIDEDSEKESKETFQNQAIDLIVKYKKIQNERMKNPQNKVIIAKVGDEEILDSDINFVLESRHLGKNTSSDESEKDEITKNMIQKAAAISFTKKNGIYPKEEDINNALKKLKESIEKDEFETKKANAVIKETGWTMDEYVESYKKDIAETFAVDNLFKYFKQKNGNDDNKKSFKKFINEIVLGEKIEKFENK